MTNTKKKTADIKKLEEKHFIRRMLYEKNESHMQKYKTLVIGGESMPALIKYEMITILFGSIPGAPGLFLRKFFYPKLFDNIKKGVLFGKNVTIRHPSKIRVDNNVIFDDNCLICARGAGEEGVRIEENVIINRGAVIQAKIGPIHIGGNTSIGSNAYLSSQGGIFIGRNVRIAGGCYISGGASKLVGDKHIVEERYTKGPIRIDDNVHLGMGAIVLDNVHIQEGAIVGPGSVVLTNVPEYAVVMGNPAKIWRKMDKTGN